MTITPMSRLTKSAPVVGNVPAEGGAYVVIRQDPGEALCHLDDQSRATFCVPTTAEPTDTALGLPRQPTLGRNGLVYVPFATAGRLGHIADNRSHERSSPRAERA